MSGQTRARTKPTVRPSSPVGPGYLPKGGAAAARAANDQWLDGRTRESAARSGVTLGVAVWAVVAASAGALFTEGAILWVLFS
jgi:hypothetical protein